MAADALSLNRAVVFGSAVVYWAGVYVQARRVRRRTGRSANTWPRGLKETLLWAGWLFVVVAWLALPFLGRNGAGLLAVTIIPWLVHPVGCALGMIMMVAGYLGTLWCYTAMGNSWRMGVNRAEKTGLVTRGPYRLVRHPIYLCQVTMVAAIPILLPSVVALLVLIIHLFCVLTKAADEESHLRNILGRTYEAYFAHTGGWFPRLRRSGSLAEPLSAAECDTVKSAKHPLK